LWRSRTAIHRVMEQQTAHTKGHRQAELYKVPVGYKVDDR